ncbi:amidohydrolase family protein [Mycolicibacterium smegmatis]|uniref:2-hydroxy-3-carboxy-6-oxo-7-methylocta-2, 4-dienoate decarboxylase n=1 Tax=Mycolicibacterium smegmatis (strain MKD8) TaxID=1214915 RepID=A0A2U9PUI9_MYCSE|nr:amidohydrolase family protein [Mycolicibacterium smegmatis]AWT55404.1 2-hydroxy-3-carboxy-6-oxo-7-methylocta-2, 4-dienoate decarboxylase [Mycolicibacterium smegmatis MKD8]
MTDAAEWWPELAPRIERSRAPKPPGTCVDAHTHLSVKPAAALAKPYFRPEYEPRSLYSSEETTRYNAEYRASPLNTAQFEEAEQRLADMDAQGVDIQLLAVPPAEYFYWLPEDEALRANRIQHERIAEVVTTWPTRFAGVANVPMNYPELAVETLREAQRDFGFHGVEVSADVLGLDLDDRRFDPFWEAVAELDMTVILHPQGFTHGRRFTDYYLVNVMCMPLASTLAVTRMILGGVWRRHPHLRVLVVHGGGYLPFYIARTDHAWRVRPELRHHLDIPPSEVLRSIYVDTNVFDARMVEQLVGDLGADHVVMGTDYPFDMSTVDPVAFLSGTRMSEDDRAQVLGGNAIRLFKINAAP